ncbi:hypothetical protein E2C01_099501 [Portunus trituberculatus]|uniref:Uncharacterized protein n=1 Tax=Portunus trituberculatus TaxID=210409 RepID=A0A5B7KH03_PORTR|nr:hypothetical protein [Portunus trituberculatus]
MEDWRLGVQPLSAQIPPRPIPLRSSLALRITPAHSVPLHSCVVLGRIFYCEFWVWLDDFI